jgi:hypothetical protein
MEMYAAEDGANLERKYIKKSDVKDVDVLPGRGKANGNHPGNIRLTGI